ncbi:substrate-binding domain-containing protein [Pseudomonas aestusnigri]|uniref:substrate-binding domain-containing protein n=1 Tax=Halopseudomonas aestusnigri TaxID=857252 RepID=UPI001D17F710|nr:substrate-binding domain-containing protein [Halopseudomonas aestusnigri]MCC4261623.1 substrate-binding domain-containing protein [Halopseudomonas aestusnigri]
MFKRNLIAVSLAFAALASAQVSADVVGGGATLPEKLYGIPGGTVGILNGSAGFNDYIGVGSGAGKRAFFNNDSNEFIWDLNGDGETLKTELVYPSPVTVDYAGSDSVVTSAELANYNAAHNSAGVPSADQYGPLVQLPSAATSVTVPYNVPGLDKLDLTSETLAEVFAGEYEVWGDVPGVDLSKITNPNLPITVVYRADGSGTTEIFLRHLNAVDSSLVPSVSNNFASAIALDSNIHVGAPGSSGVANAVNTTPGAITYVSPDYADFDNEAAVVRVNGVLPEEVNVVAALESISLPLDVDGDGVADPADPLAWVPAGQLADPSAGYSIVGVTNLIFSQCYADTAAGGDLSKIKGFLARHYDAFGANNDADISAHSLIPLPFDWKIAVEDNFVTNLANNNLDIGNTTICNGIGRPL